MNKRNFSKIIIAVIGLSLMALLFSCAYAQPGNPVDPDYKPLPIDSDPPKGLDPPLPKDIICVSIQVATQSGKPFFIL